VSGSSFPNFGNKHSHDAIINPSEVVARFVEASDLVIPASVVLTYQGLIPGYLTERGYSKAEGYPGPWRSLWLDKSVDHPTVGVANGFGIGAPAASTVLEDLIALGVRQFISIGPAGCLNPDLAFGDIVVCAAAIRDEGLSHHYVPSAKCSYPSPSLTTRLEQALSRKAIPHRSGTSWTIDAPYRETVAEARSYQAEGVLTVEMEAAALFAVAEYRGVEVASAFIVSDHLLAGDRWNQAFASDEVRSGSFRLLDTCLEMLTSSSSG
jgi:uridine phosphorylase